MIAYFETSALIKLFIDEPGSEVAATTWDAVDARLSSRLTYPEARAALAAARRLDRLSPSDFRVAKERFEAWFRQINVVEMTPGLAAEAGRLAEGLGLRAYDAVHLASASLLDTSDLLFVTWDKELISASKVLRLRVVSDK